MSKSPKEIQKFLDTHTPNRAERRKFESRYKKQQRDIKAGRIKPPAEVKLSWWRRLINFIMRK